MQTKKLSRRDFLRLSALTAAGAALAGCACEPTVVGKEVKVTEGDFVYEGIAESVDRDGSLFLRRPDGRLTRVIVGDVTLRT